MKRYWIAAITAGIFTISAVAQTSAGGSASGNASVTPGQTSAGASTSQSAQAPGASANVDANANANAGHQHDSNKKNDKSGSAAANGNGSAGAAAGAGDASAILSSGATLQAELTKSVDAKKAKSGDEVTAKLTQDVKSNGKVVLRKGSKLVGHVTEAQAKDKQNTESKLGIVFDKAMVKGGQEVSFNGVIQALAPPVQGTLSAGGDETGNIEGGSRGNGGMGGGARTSGGPLGGAVAGATSTTESVAGGVTNTAGSVANSTVGGAVNNTAGAAVNGTFNSAAHGVVGMPGLALNTAAAGSAQGSVISSASRNVKLDSGTQMVLQVTGSAAAAH
jgi:hypothetical protein